jgi:AcrR family transcriptional regulator
MGKKRIDQNKIIIAFLVSSFDKSAGATSLADIAEQLNVKKASLYNHFSSRDNIYEATLSFCAEYLAGVSFLPDEYQKLAKQGPDKAFSKIISQYIRSYEIDPLFPIYSFVHSEQYFNSKAVKIAADEQKKIIDGCSIMFRLFITGGTFILLTDEQIQNSAGILAALLTSSLNNYIMEKKDIVRKNPETGNGSLFSLPTDTTAVSTVTKLATSFISQFITEK